MPFTPSYHVPEERQAYTMKAGPIGCLMLHGFLGSPLSSRPLAAYLQERGITVHCPLLPGHGQYPNKLYKIPKEAWMDETEEALRFLQDNCDEIFLMGHSMGTVLGARLAIKYGGFKGQIMISPAYDVPDPRIKLMRFARYFMPYYYPLRSRRMQDLVYKRLREFDPEIDLEDPEVQARLPEITRVPTSGIDEMRKMLAMGRKLWPRLDLPIIIFQGKLDEAASYQNTQRLFELLPGKEKKLLLFEDAGHELMRPFDSAYNEVWTKVYAFIRSHSSLADSESDEHD
ncbi:MAG: alpha/beta hydrolase [Candidatus Promineifilaceae bacterium]